MKEGRGFPNLKQELVTYHSLFPKKSLGKGCFMGRVFLPSAQHHLKRAFMFFISSSLKFLINLWQLLLCSQAFHQCFSKVSHFPRHSSCHTCGSASGSSAAGRGRAGRIPRPWDVRGMQGLRESHLWAAWQRGSP